MFFFSHENWPKCSWIISGLKCFVFDISNTSFLRPSHVTKDRPTNIIIVLFNIYFLFNQKEYRWSLMHFLKSSSAYNWYDAASMFYRMWEHECRQLFNKHCRSLLRLKVYARYSINEIFKKYINSDSKSDWFFNIVLLKATRLRKIFQKTATEFLR